MDNITEISKPRLKCRSSVKSGTNIGEMHPNDMLLGVEYHYLEINIPKVTLIMKIFATIKDREDYFNKVVSESTNKYINYESFTGRFRIMREGV